LNFGHRDLEFICYFQPEADQPLAEVLNKIGIWDFLLSQLGTKKKDYSTASND
jgi:hypothetical protein